MGLRTDKQYTTESNEIILAEPQEIIIEDKKQEIEQKLKNSPEIERIVESIDVYDMNSLLKFGDKPAQELAKFSDAVLNNVQSTKIEDSSVILNRLKKIMDNFNQKDFTKNQNFIEKLFFNAKAQVDKIIKKYHAMGSDIDKITAVLMTYQDEILKSNVQLDNMFNENVKYYEELTKYILAGEAAVDELKTSIIPEMEQKYNVSQDNMVQMEITQMKQVQSALEQRVYDLKLSQTVALQTMPSLRMIQVGNYNLMRKINSAFIVTLPVFKNCLVQALHLKRQSLQSEALEALDKTTNEMILRNAQNTADQSIKTAMQANNSSIEVETLQKAWNEIMRGVTETQKVQEEASQKRIEGTKQLEDLNKRIKNLE
ncbi:toxic anion resistance protein [uncultured Clostridium sp.]|uniref:toxic anion resistance protein n=1 Tax=uncultured Clostridium sp. TaxID=59620 RepID=UPI0025DAC4CF|nr:toxic anion resistance protein [uncultured Clostridium sp.]